METKNKPDDLQRNNDSIEMQNNTEEASQNYNNTSPENITQTTAQGSDAESTASDYNEPEYSNKFETQRYSINPEQNYTNDTNNNAGYNEYDTGQYNATQNNNAQYDNNQYDNGQYDTNSYNNQYDNQYDTNQNYDAQHDNNQYDTNQSYDTQYNNNQYDTNQNYNPQDDNNQYDINQNNNVPYNDNQYNNYNNSYNPDYNNSYQSSPYQNDANNNTKKKRKYTPIIIIILALIAVVSAVYFIGNATHPFNYVSTDNTVYIFENESAKAELLFENKGSSSKTLNLKFSDTDSISKVIPANSSEKIPVTFRNITEDTTMKAKYGFLGMKDAKVNIVVLKKSDIYFDTTGVKISDSNNMDITTKKYSTPNSKVTFKITGHNKSNKDFIRSYDFKVNGKQITTVQAQWLGANKSQTTISADYDFKKEGIYNVELAGKKTKFVVSKKYKTPKNGTMLKNKGGGSGILKIENKFGHDIIVSISRTSSPKVAQKRCYIKAKSKATISGVPSGTYILYVNSGKDYSKITDNFLDTTAVSRSRKLLPFTATSRSYTVWNIKLGVTNGNMGTEGLKESDLPN